MARAGINIERRGDQSRRNAMAKLLSSVVARLPYPVADSIPTLSLTALIIQSCGLINVGLFQQLSIWT